MRRAVREEQKLVRRQQILDTAWQLFQENDYDQVNIIDVAKGAGLAKGTVYLYFGTKEELFLALLSDQFEDWFDEIDDSLQTDNDLAAAPALAEMLAETLAERPLLMRLFALLHPILEKNIKPEVALPFKQMLLDRISQTGALLETRLPFLEPGQGAQLQMQIYAIILGLQQMSEPAPVVCTLIEEHPALAAMTIDFAPTFRATITSLIYGLASQADLL
jgi:AcrR family transcriptional regulator